MQLDIKALEGTLLSPNVEIADDRFRIIGDQWMTFTDLSEAQQETYLTKLRSVIRDRATLKADRIHAQFMQKLTGGATTEERDTWPVKVSASEFLMTASDEIAQAAIALITSGDPTAMDNLETLVQDVGPDLTDLRELAVVILTKSRAYKRLIGVASRLRREARAAIAQATHESQPIESVGDALDMIENDMMAQADVAIAEWQGAS